MREKGLRWALPGIVFASAFAMSAACGSQGPGDPGSGNCPSDENPTTNATTGNTTGAGAAGPTSSVTATSTSASTGSSMGTGGSVQKYDTPTPEEIASRLHSCHKLPYGMLSTFLSNRGVAMPPPGSGDGRGTQEMVFGQQTMLGALLAPQSFPNGNNPDCNTGTNTTNGGDGSGQLCGNNQQCFCDQDIYANPFLVNPKTGQANQNKNCLTVGVNAAGVAMKGYCVDKPATAAFLYLNGKDSFSVPKQDSRLGEKEEHTTASALRLMDIFIQAAPQIVANIGNPAMAPACTLNGKNKPMFDPNDGSCVQDSVSCLIGMPATDDHMLLCNLIVQKADPKDPTDVMKKRNLAVAALLSAAHSCE